ncbi:MAG: hypothetical protein JWQ45_2409 [Blastococcus sp.]|jgi:hypothetical protein|nr:hypothetical protein [Blastococcus sp.]
MTPPPNVPPARASDADREAVVRELHDAVARGLLSLEEGDERMAAAYAARFAHDLPPLTADLPPAPALAPAAPGWRSIAVLVWLQLRTLFTREAWRSVRARPRRAIAVVMALGVLSFGAAAAGEAFDHGEHADRQIEHVEN